MTLTLRTLALAPLACLLLSGCHVVEHKDGDKDNVDISTPFGGMHVKTNSDGDTAAIGITAYPGAVPLKESDHKDANSANVDMSFGSFHLGVKAASFQTPDQPDKVLAYYRKNLTKFGDVIECRGNHAIGTPTETSQGLSCNDQNHTHVTTIESDSDDIELKAGSALHQHIVGVESKDGGTKIGLVALDLPSHLSDHDSKDSE
jgi:hypothetical protein